MSEPRESECRDIESMFAAFVDGDAASCDAERVRRHVESCACCRDRVAWERAAREAVRSRRGGLRARAPQELKSRCASYAARSAPAASAAPSSSRLRRWAPVSVAATVLFAVGAVFGLGLNNKVQALAFQTTVDHVKCSRFNAGSAPPDAVHAARAWQAKFGWALRVPQSTPPELELRAVRRCAVTDGRVAHLIYSWLGEPLSVYVLPRQTVGQGAEFVRRFHHNSVIWSQNSRTYILVTSRQRDPALEKVVAYVRANAY